MRKKTSKRTSKMNSKHTLTPTEINKFTNCPYQWYYERLHGIKKLTELAKRKNKDYGLDGNGVSVFSKGLKHHKDVFLYYSGYKKWK